jgi:hypothetical protein
LIRASTPLSCRRRKRPGNDGRAYQRRRDFPFFFLAAARRGFRFAFAIFALAFAFFGVWSTRSMRWRSSNHCLA